MKPRPFFLAVFAAVLSFLCTACDENARLAVWIASGPTNVARGTVATYYVTSGYGFFGSGTLRYRIEWGDSMTMTSDVHSIGDTVLFTHAWRKSGTYAVTALALGNSNSRSYPLYVVVTDTNDPVIDSARFHCKWRPVELTVFAHDARSESLRLAVQWGDGRSETTGFVASPCSFSVTHPYGSWQTVYVACRVLSANGAMSPADTLSGPVGPDGEVTNLWLDGFSGSPVIAGDGSEEVTYAIGPDGFYGVRPGQTIYKYPGAFLGDPAFSSRAGHLYAGSDEGRLHAFTPTLGLAWTYPPAETIAGPEWGPVAVNGEKLYAGCGDSIFYLIDSRLNAPRIAAFGLHASVVGAPVIDADGNVYFGTDSAYLYKLTGDLRLVWRMRLQSSGSIGRPIIGADGTVYCSSDFNFVFAVDPADGRVKWSAQLPGNHLCSIVGSDALYAGASSGRLYKLDLGTGATIWEKQLGTDELAAAPIAASGGYLYVQSGADRVYYVSRSSGDSVWVANCAAYLPREPRGRTMSFSSGVSNPTVDADGKLWIVGKEALYKLNSYAPLDTAFPWPKWQHDLYNTGHVGGGR